MSSRSQGTKNRHASRKHRSARKRATRQGAQPLAKARGNHGHAAPTPAQFGARAPMAGRPTAPDVPCLSLRGRYAAPSATPPRNKEAVAETALPVTEKADAGGQGAMQPANLNTADVPVTSPPALVRDRREPASPARHDMPYGPQAAAASPPAMPLHKMPEPLTTPQAANRTPPRITPRPDIPLPRHLAPAKPTAGLWGAMGSWLRSAGRMLASGFMVKKTRTRTASPANLREQTEITQLRAENRRLRLQLDAMAQARAKAARVKENAPG